MNGFTIGVKRPERIDDGPGPGHYDPNDEQTRHRSPEPIIMPEKIDYDGYFVEQQKIQTYQRTSKVTHQQVDISPAQNQYNQTP